MTPGICSPGAKKLLSHAQHDNLTITRFLISCDHLQGVSRLMKAIVGDVVSRQANTEGDALASYGQAAD